MRGSICFDVILLMADIFISYSKADRDKVVMLAAYLESEGWTVWWDTNLAAGDAFRNGIMRELGIFGLGLSLAITAGFIALLRWAS